MATSKTPRTQLNATRRWEEKNPENTKLKNYRRSARTFARHHATVEDMQELMEIFEQENPNYKEGE